MGNFFGGGQSPEFPLLLLFKIERGTQIYNLKSVPKESHLYIEKNCATYVQQTDFSLIFRGVFFIHFYMTYVLLLTSDLLKLSYE